MDVYDTPELLGFGLVDEWDEFEEALHKREWLRHGDRSILGRAPTLDDLEGVPSEDWN